MAKEFRPGKMFISKEQKTELARSSQITARYSGLVADLIKATQVTVSQILLKMGIKEGDEVTKFDEVEGIVDFKPKGLTVGKEPLSILKQK